MLKQYFVTWKSCYVCAYSYLTLCNPMDCSPLLCPWNFPGKNARVCCHATLLGVLWCLNTSLSSSVKSISISSFAFLLPLHSSHSPCPGEITYSNTHKHTCTHTHTHTRWNLVKFLEWAKIKKGPKSSMFKQKYFHSLCIHFFFFFKIPNHVEKVENGFTIL